MHSDVGREWNQQHIKLRLFHVQRRLMMSVERAPSIMNFQSFAFFRS